MRNDHTCCWYCHEDIHTYCAFVDADIHSQEDFFATYTVNGIVAACAMEILDVIPAREADAHRLLDERKIYGKQTVVYDDGSVREEEPEIFGNIWQITYRDLTQTP